MKTKIWVILAILGLSATACSKSGTPGAKEPAAQEPMIHRWLPLIPSDSPLVVVGLRPVPREFLDWAFKHFEPIFDDLRQAVESEPEDPDLTDEQRAVMAELRDALLAGNLDNLGISLETETAVYAIGPSLAARVALKDGTRLRAFTDRFLAATDTPNQTENFAGVDYWSTDLEDTGAMMLLAIRETEAIVGILPAQAKEQILPVLFGQQRPEQSLADTGTLQGLVDQYDFMGVSPGYIDSAAVVRMFTGRASALTNRIMAAAGMQPPELSDECRQDFDALAELVPGMVFGYHELSNKRLKSRVVIELRPDLAVDLATLQAPVPTLATIRTDKPLFAIGLGMKMDKALEWLRIKLEAVAKQPYECPDFKGINEAIAELARALEDELPPYITNFHGLSAALTSLDIASETGAGYAVLNIDNPMMVMQMAQALSPELAQAQIRPDGIPVAVSLGVPNVDPIYIAVKDSRIVVGVGKGMPENLAKVLQGEPRGRTPMLVMGYNYTSFFEFMLSADDDFEELDEDARRVVQSLAKAVGFYLTEFSVDERGIHIVQDLELL